MKLKIKFKLKKDLEKIFCEYFALLIFIINFWYFGSMTDMCLKFHLDTLNLNGMSSFGDLCRFFETA
jgi:hypothetical protein